MTFWRKRTGVYAELSDARCVLIRAISLALCARGQKQLAEGYG
jgi:hypothetical protein